MYVWYDRISSGVVGWRKWRENDEGNFLKWYKDRERHRESEKGKYALS